MLKGDQNDEPRATPTEFTSMTFSPPSIFSETILSPPTTEAPTSSSLTRLDIIPVVDDLSKGGETALGMLSLKRRQQSEQLDTSIALRNENGMNKRIKDAHRFTNAFTFNAFPEYTDAFLLQTRCDLNASRDFTDNSVENITPERRLFTHICTPPTLHRKKNETSNHREIKIPVPSVGVNETSGHIKPFQMDISVRQAFEINMAILRKRISKDTLNNDLIQYTKRS